MSMFSWGANSHGQLGHGATSEQEDSPVRVRGVSGEVRHAACGGGHTLVVDSLGRLFACGWNHKRQLGTGGGDSHVLRRLWNLSGITFVSACAGWDTSCAVTDDRFLFVWGSNSHGQLGLPRGHFPGNVKPVRLQVNACAVSMGLRHTALVNARGEVWTTGCGRRGQLGHGDAVTQLDRFTSVAGVRGASHVACGQHHTLAWSAAERALFAWGDNKHGQLLLDPERYPRASTPHKIDIGVRCDVRRLACGWSGAALWLQDGRVLVWGRDTYGQLGRPSTIDVTRQRLSPLSLPEGEEVTDVALGAEHGVCVGRSGRAWGWGWNEHGNTGAAAPADSECLRTPAPVRLPDASAATALHVYAGGAHNFLVCQQ